MIGFLVYYGISWIKDVAGAGVPIRIVAVLAGVALVGLLEV